MEDIQISDVIVNGEKVTFRSDSKGNYAKFTDCGNFLLCTCTVSFDDNTTIVTDGSGKDVTMIRERIC